MKNKKAQTQPIVAQQPIVQKKSRLWIWILIILIVIVVGVGLYFWLSGDGGSIGGLGSSVPKPPALPN
jgi:flagellar basal body-associated protein FliL|tara:strand:- start:366 stop:569 length:204 start_codon:yes stop_codon:yes gene_type:complete